MLLNDSIKNSTSYLNYRDHFHTCSYDPSPSLSPPLTFLTTHGQIPPTTYVTPTRVVEVLDYGVTYREEVGFGFRLVGPKGGQGDEPRWVGKKSDDNMKKGSRSGSWGQMVVTSDEPGWNTKPSEPSWVRTPTSVVTPTRVVGVLDYNPY
ncbi:hypothetical protein L1887_37090 [Cichorium endivia]|nr:hypothetical protein L1887_37090 [Cichorium endivia]